MSMIILARAFDPTADAVVRALDERDIPVFRTCLSDFPTRLRLDAQMRAGRWTGRLWTEHHQVELEQVRSIWYRNPATYSFPASLTTEEQDFCYREAKLGLGGVLACLDVVWANSSHSMAISSPTNGKWPLSVASRWPIW